MHMISRFGPVPQYTTGRKTVLAVVVGCSQHQSGLLSYIRLGEAHFLKSTLGN